MKPMMKAAATILFLLAFSSAAHAQNATPEQTKEWLAACLSGAVKDPGCPKTQPTPEAPVQLYVPPPDHSTDHALDKPVGTHIDPYSVVVPAKPITTAKAPALPEAPPMPPLTPVTPPPPPHDYSKDASQGGEFYSGACGSNRLVRASSCSSTRISATSAFQRDAV